MHAYLITGYDKEKIESEIVKLIEGGGIRRLGFNLKKILDVRELSKFTNLSLNEKSAIVIENIDEASTDAQNAFLKNLEEPQENLIYILTAKSQDSVLPTIASRCQVIEIGGGGAVPEVEAVQSVENFLNSKEGERLKEISKITKREEAAEFMKTVIFVLHKRLLTDPKLVYSVELAVETLRRLEANGNVQIQLTNFAISI